MGVDFNFNKFDFGDYELDERLHDIIVDLVNATNMMAASNSENPKGELENIKFDPEENTVEIIASFNNAVVDINTLTIWYAARLYGAQIVLKAENEYEFYIVISLSGCFRRKEAYVDEAETVKKEVTEVKVQLIREYFNGDIDASTLSEALSDLDESDYHTGEESK